MAFANREALMFYHCRKLEACSSEDKHAREHHDGLLLAPDIVKSSERLHTDVVLNEVATRLSLAEITAVCS